MGEESSSRLPRVTNDFPICASRSFLGSVRVVFRVPEIGSKGPFSVHLDYIPGFVQTEVGHRCRHQGVCTRLQVDQLRCIVFLATSHQERARQHRDVFVGRMPVGRHLDLSFTTDADHVQATLLVWVAGDEAISTPGMSGFQTSWPGATMAWPCANANIGMRKIVTEKTEPAI